MPPPALGAKCAVTRALAGPITSSAGRSARAAWKCCSSTSASRASPSTWPSHRSSSRSPAVAGSGKTIGNACRAARSRRVVTRIWWTASGSSRRTAVSSALSRAACSSMYAEDDPAGLRPAVGRTARPGWRAGMPRPSRAGVHRQRALKLGRAAGRPQPAASQALGGRPQQARAAAGQLDLEFVPARQRGGRAQALRRHLVLGDLGQRGPGRVAQDRQAATGLDASHRPERAPRACARTRRANSAGTGSPPSAAPGCPVAVALVAGSAESRGGATRPPSAWRFPRRHRAASGASPRRGRPGGAAS